jgi:cell division protein FtsQ
MNGMNMTLIKKKMSRKAPKKQVRGASSRQPKPSRVFSVKKLFPLLAVIGLLVISTAVYRGAEVLLSQPVSRVVVNGEYKYVENAGIITEVKPFLEAGFIGLDLAGIREQLLKQPWVYDVALARHWPDEVVITVIEQTPIAHWGEDGFLNHRGELFEPSKAVTITGLPWLNGPNGETEQVMNNFRELNKFLAADNLALNKLLLNERGSWTAKLSNNIEIVFGNGQLMEKIQRLLFAYDQGLSTEFMRIKTIDMRYNNGFAVAWQQQKS